MYLMARSLSFFRVSVMLFVLLPALLVFFYFFVVLFCIILFYRTFLFGDAEMLLSTTTPMQLLHMHPHPADVAADDHELASSSDEDVAAGPSAPADSPSTSQRRLPESAGGESGDTGSSSSLFARTARLGVR
jgi:hypothetical protein